jgi:uncharacterized protein (DUF934 family)
MSTEAETVIVTDAGFGTTTPDEVFVAAGDLGTATQADLFVDLPADGDPGALAAVLDRVRLVRIPFKVFSDGRGFTLARELRRMGYRGRIRAEGHLISDQWRLARACGIDEAEIAAAQARRQPETAWRESRGRFAYLDLLG